MVAVECCHHTLKSVCTLLYSICTEAGILCMYIVSESGREIWLVGVSGFV